MTINREVFYNTYRTIFGGLTQQQVDGMNEILGRFEQEPVISDLRHFAYMLATTKLETADTFHPVEEIGKGRGRKYGAEDPGTGFVYYGRGYVQLTWRSNYKLFGIDHEPHKALEPATAYRIMSDGMRMGVFTGKGLSDFIKGGKCDYYNARRIINGLDCAAKVATYAVAFEKILSLSAGGVA